MTNYLVKSTDPYQIEGKADSAPSAMETISELAALLMVARDFLLFADPLFMVAGSWVFLAGDFFLTCHVIMLLIFVI